MRTQQGTARVIRIVTTGGWRTIGILCRDREFSIVTDSYRDKKKKRPSGFGASQPSLGMLLYPVDTQYA